MHVLFLNALFYMVKFMPLSEVRLYNKKSNAMFSFFFKEHSLIITTILRFCKKSVVLLLFYIGTFEQMHKSETDDISNMPCGRSPLAIYNGKLFLGRASEHNKGTETRRE